MLGTVDVDACWHVGWYAFATWFPRHTRRLSANLTHPVATDNTKFIFYTINVHFRTTTCELFELEHPDGPYYPLRKSTRNHKTNTLILALFTCKQVELPQDWRINNKWFTANNKPDIENVLSLYVSFVGECRCDRTLLCIIKQNVRHNLHRVWPRSDNGNTSRRNRTGKTLNSIHQV